MIDLAMITTHLKERVDEGSRQQFVEQIPHLDLVDLLDAQRHRCQRTALLSYEKCALS